MSKTTNKIRTIAVRVTALALAILAILNIIGAFLYPIEMETREGTIWLHVLAMKAGINIYDHSKVAFVNMNHGPIDPIVKTLVSQLLPFLGPVQVARSFVVLLAFSTFYFCYQFTRKRFWDALLFSSTLYLLWLSLGSFYPLVGRSDPTALFFLTLLGAQAWPYLSVTNVRDSKKLGALRHILLGVTCSLVGLTNWRYLPVAFPLMALSIYTANKKILSAQAFKMFMHYLLGMALPVILILGLIFNFDLDLYYRHFIGFFIDAGTGWGIKQLHPFSLFPDAVVQDGGESLAISFLACGAVAISFRKTKASFLWFFLLCLVWLVTCYGYFRNSLAGGAYYFGPYYILAVLFLAVYLSKLKKPFPFWREIFCALALFCLPILAIGRQSSFLFLNAPIAQKCVEEMKSITGNQEIFSEDIQFFKTSYTGETVDMGDTAEGFRFTGYLGEAFNQSADRYFNRLANDPPPFIMRGIVSSFALRTATIARYEIVSICRAPMFVNGDTHIHLLRLKKQLSSKNVSEGLRSRN